MLSASGHKFHGPKGVGFLYVKKGIKVFNLIEGGAQERNRRAGTENVPGIAAMATALKESVVLLDSYKAKLTPIRDICISTTSLVTALARLNRADHLAEERSDTELSQKEPCCLYFLAKRNSHTPSESSPR